MSPWSTGGPKRVYVGIALHARQFRASVLDQHNSTIFEQTLPTSCDNLKAAVRAFAGRKRVVFEESTLAAWAYRVRQPCAEQALDIAILKEAASGDF